MVSRKVALSKLDNYSISAGKTHLQIQSDKPYPFLEVAGWISSNMHQKAEMIRSKALVALAYHHFGENKKGMDLLVDSVLLLDTLSQEEKHSPHTFAMLAGALYKLQDYQDSDALVSKLEDPMVVEMIASSSSQRLDIAQMRFLREEFEEGWIMLRSIEFEDLTQEEIDRFFRNLIAYSSIPMTQWDRFVLDSRYEVLALLHFLPILAFYPNHPVHTLFKDHKVRFLSKCRNILDSAQSVEEELRYLLVTAVMSTASEAKEELLPRARKLGENLDPIVRIWVGKLEMLVGNPYSAKLEFESVFKFLHQRGLSINDEEILEELVRCLLVTGTKDTALDMISSVISPERRARLLVEFQSDGTTDEAMIMPLQALVFNHGRILDALSEAMKLKEKLDSINDIFKTGLRFLILSCIGAIFWFLGKT